MFLIDRLFTKVVQTLSAVILEPTIIAQAQVFVELHLPDAIKELSPEAILQQPPPTVELVPEAVFERPPPTVE